MRGGLLALLGLSIAGCAAPGLSRSRSEPRSVTAAAERPEPRQRIGVVARRDVKLDRLELRLDEGRRCPRRRLPEPDGGVVTASAADGAGCRLYPYRGSLPVFAVRGSEPPVQVLTLETELDGSVTLPFARVDAWLRAQGEGSLDGYQRLDLGRGAWAGSVDLVRLRQFLADWHFRWVSRGRGSPGLFAVRHPDHEQAAVAGEWAVESRIQRQERDHKRVEAGELSPAAFLERHVWSPFRDAVEEQAMSTGD